MDNQSTKPSWWSDQRNIAKAVVGGGLALVGLYFGMPYILKILTDLRDGAILGMQLIWTLAALVLSIIILVSPGTWRKLDYVITAVSRITTFWIVDWDPFAIQQTEIKSMKKDAEKLEQQANKLLGEEERLTAEINKNEQERQDAAAQYQVALSDGKEQLANSYLNDKINAEDFIKDVQPLRDDIRFLRQYCQKAYEDAEYTINDVQRTLDKEISKYKAITAGESAMKSARRALLGDGALSADAKLARERVSEKIAAKIGNIKGAIKVTSKVMEKKDIADRAKLLRAKEEIQLLNPGGQAFVPLPALNTNEMVGAHRSFSQEQTTHKGLLD